MQAFIRVDVQTGETQTWFPGIRCFCEELVFVPGPKAATEETDGFLLGMVYDAARHTSFLAVSSSATCDHMMDFTCTVHKAVCAVMCVELLLGVVCRHDVLLQRLPCCIFLGCDRGTLCLAL